MREFNNQYLSVETREKTIKHPCYNAQASSYARVHLPVAPECNISCNYCNRKYDCANESRPGVTSRLMTPEEAVGRFIEARSAYRSLQVVGVAGPGDALANYQATKKTFKLIRAFDPSVTFCISTNGLMLPDYADSLLQMGVSHITVTINALNKKVGSKIYRWVNYKGDFHKGEEGAELLIERQLAGLRKLRGKDVLCKVNIVMISGINDHHIEEVVRAVKEYGVFMTNIMPLIPVKGSRFESLPPTEKEALNNLRQQCEVHLQQMYHCRQCRSDAVGCLNDERRIVI